jgi:hypothetical protein
MKPLPLAVLILAAAIASWWLFGSDDVREPDSGVGENPIETPAGPDASSPDPTSGDPAAQPLTAQGGASTEPALKTEPPKRRKFMLPLADKFIEQATWNDEEAEIVLRQAAEAARKGLRLSNTARKRLANVRITLELGRTPVPFILDKVTKPHTLGWNVSAGTIYIFDDDD